MGAQSISSHTLKSDATTTIVARTTTIISEHGEVFSDDSHEHRQGTQNIVRDVRKTLRDYWFPSHATGHSEHADTDEDEDEDETGQDSSADPSLSKANSVMRRAYDYWKSLTQDAEEEAKELVIKAREARDDAAKEAKWAMFGYKKEAREAYEAAEEKYREALAAAEKVHDEALEKARSRWFQQADCTQKEVGEKHNIADQVGEMTHKKWDQFKAAVDSFAFNPPKYACSPSSQYWFSRQNPAADSGWDCREIWDHPSRRDHGHSVPKTLPKKHLPSEKVHGVLEGLLQQAGLKAKTAPSVTSFDSTLKSVKDQYNHVLDRIARNEPGAVEELDTLVEKVKGVLNEAKYREEQTESWLTSQWNAVIDNAGETKDQYERVFKSALQNIKKGRTDAYTALSNNLQKTINNARSNIKDALKTAKNDRSKVNKAIQDASSAFSTTLKDAEAKIKAAPKNAYDNAVEFFNRETAQLKAKLEAAAEVARKSGSSISRHVSKSGSSISRQASKSASSISHHASKSVSSAAARVSESGKGIRKDASRKLSDVKSRASSEYERATASVSSMWGAATPFAPFNKVHDSYQHLLGDARSNLFGHHDTSYGHHELSSFYGALTALYLLFMARQIWLRRKCCSAASEAHGDLHVTKRGRRHSHSHSHNNEADSSDDQDHHHHSHHDKHGKRSHHEHGKHEEHGLAHQHHAHGEHYGHHHHHNSFSAVLKLFTSVVPMTLVMLVFLELAGFSRVALHTLFAGLVASQLLLWGYFNNVMEQLGILDSALGEAMAGRSAREMGCYLAWTVFGLAAAANAINVLHDQ